MRSIKFRAWNKRRKIMLPPFTLWDVWEDGVEAEHGNGSMFHNREYGLFEKEDYVFMQCTGLKDKNGTMIFEGDILKYNINSIEFIPVEIPEIFFRIADGDYSTDVFGEVVGNIYENSNLLKQNERS